MSASESRSTVVLQLAEEFLERYRQGQRPSLKEYIDRHPELAAEIKDVFPAMALMENVALGEESLIGDATGPTVATESTPPEQLGDYRILREVGRGGMGIVYEAEQVSLGRHVALKVLPRKMFVDDSQRRRFEREAKAAAKLHHTNIVPVFGVGEHDGMPYYVMQFIQGLGLDQVCAELRHMRGDGETQATHKGMQAEDVVRSLMTGVLQGLSERIESPEPSASGAGGVSPSSASQGANTSRSGESGKCKLPDSFTLSSSSVTLPGSDASGGKVKKWTFWQSVARIGVQVADALEYAHKQGIQHRDIKPSNLLLDAAGTVWVTDFGLARADNEDHLTRTGDIVGTLRYMPPEAFEGGTDARSDLYSLGLTLYELLALRPAFAQRERHKLVKQVTTEEPPRLDKLKRSVPRDLVTIVHKAIDREPARRYQTAGELSADLQRFLDDEPIRARRISSRERLARWCRHHPGVAMLTAALAVILLTVTAVSLVAAARFDGLARHQTATARAAVEARDDAEAARRKMAITLTDMHTAHGLIAAQRGEAAHAMLWFANAARLAHNDPQRDWANRVRVSVWGRQAKLPVRALAHDGAGLRVMAFRRDGDLLLTLTGQGRCFVWDWRREQALEWANGRGPIQAACFSPDGQWLALGLPSGCVEVHDVPSGDVLHRFDHPGAVTALAFSRDGHYLAIASDVVRVWNCRKQTFVLGAWRHPQAVPSLVFNPSSDQLATACLDRQVRLFAVSEGAAVSKPLFAPLRHVPNASSSNWPAPAYIDNGRQLVTITGRTEVTCWDPNTGKPSKLGRLTTTPYDLGTLVADPDGKSFAAGGYYGPQVWNLSNGGAAASLLVHRNQVYACAYSPDGAMLLTASKDRTAKLWSLPDRKLLGHVLAHQDQVCNVAFSPDGVFLATGQGNGLVRIWRRPDGNRVIHRLPYDNGPMIAKLSPDGRHVTASHFKLFGWSWNTQRARVYESAAGRPAGPDFFVGGELRQTALSPDGRTAAAASVVGEAGQLYVWDFPSGRPAFASVALPNPPDSIAFAPDGLRVAVLCAGGELLVIDVREPAKLRRFVQEGWTRRGFPLGGHLQFTRDGCGLIASSATEIHVRDAATGRLRYPPLPVVEHPPSGGVCTDFALSTDGCRLATAVWGGAKAARVWDLDEGKPLSEPLSHPNHIYQVRFSPDGRRILTACCDGQVRLWDWQTATLACPPLKHNDEVYAAVFSPDGRWGLTSCRDTTIGVWDLATGKPLLPLLHLLKGGITGLNVDVTADGKRALASAGFNGLYSIDLGDLSATDDMDIDDLCIWTELASGYRIHDGDLAGLASEEWLARWRAFRQRYPDYGVTLFLPPNDPRFWLDRARWLAEQKRTQEVEAAFAKAVQLEPGDPEVWKERGRIYFVLGQKDKASADFRKAVELLGENTLPDLRAASEADKLFARLADDVLLKRLTAALQRSPEDMAKRRQRGDWFARHGRWREAAADYTIARQRTPNDAELWLHAAPVLALSDPESYRRQRREMLKRLAQTRNPAEAERAAKASLLLPETSTEMEQAWQLAERAITLGKDLPWMSYFLFCKGLADYRRGNFHAAVEKIDPLVPSIASIPDLTTLCHLVLAMALERQGEAKAAREHLAKAAELLKQYLYDLSSFHMEASQYRHDWLIAWLLYHEAQSLIEGNKAESKK